MSLTKNDIGKNIAKKTSISNQKAKQLLENFIQVVVSNSKKRTVKISGFGSFSRKTTPSRIGRNPKTGEEHQISERNKLYLTLSNSIKDKIN